MTNSFSNCYSSETTSNETFFLLIWVSLKKLSFEFFIMKVNETCSEETNAGGNGRGYIRWVKCRFLASAEGTAAVFMSYSSLLVLGSLISWVPGLKHNQEVQQSWFFNSVSWPSWRNEHGSACDTVNNRRDVAHVFIYNNSVLFHFYEVKGVSSVQLLLFYLT